MWWDGCRATRLGGAWLEGGQDDEEWTGVNGQGYSGSQETGSDVGDGVGRCLG